MKKLAIIRGKFLNKFDMQSYEPLVGRYAITAFGSTYPFQDHFSFPVKKLFSPMDLPAFPYNMQILNRVCVDAHHLCGLEKSLTGFDIVDTAETYFYFTKQALIAKQKKLVKKVVVRVYENISFNNEGIWGRRDLKRFARHTADHFIAVTKLSKDALVQEGVKSKNITVIGHGIDTKQFAPDKTHWQNLKHPKNTVLTVLFVGRLEKEKGIYDVVDAFHLLCQKQKEVRLMIVGSGSKQFQVMRKIRSYGLENHCTITHADYDQMPTVYKQADIVIAPSKTTKTWKEQFSIALLEAQSMGLPIVTTRSGGIPENVGNAGLYCEEGDPQSLFHQMHVFAEHPDVRMRYARISRERALKIHDIHLIAKKLDDVYHAL